MTLKRKLVWRDGAMLLCLVLLAGAALWGMWGMKQIVALSVFEFDQLQKIESAEVSVSSAKDLLRAGDASAARGQIGNAVVGLQGFLSPDAPQSGIDYSKEAKLARQGVANLKSVS